MTYPVTEPYDHGWLDVGDGHRLYWDIAGNPTGKPAVLLHGGPGSGFAPGWRRWFDPARYRVVGFDQRQCGRSTPSAADPVVNLSTNTTAHLVADIERVREHLAIARWLVWGGSWGTTLGLAYAEAHPDRVSEMILASVVGTKGRRETDWITRSMGRVFPEQWARFVGFLPPADRDGDLTAAYNRLLLDPDPAVHEPAAVEWCAWEDTHVGTYQGATHDTRYDDPAFRLCFARLVTHYWSNDCFLEDGALLAGAHRLAGIPGVLVHGRLDISGPPDVPWELAKAWPDAELHLVDDAGHHGSATSTHIVVAATDRLAAG